MAQVPLSPSANPAHGDPIPSPGPSPQPPRPASQPAASPAGALRPLAHATPAPAAATSEVDPTSPLSLAQVSGPRGRAPCRAHAGTRDARDAPALQSGAEGDWQQCAAAAAVPGGKGWALGGSGDDSGKENAGARPVAHGSGRLQGARGGGTALWDGWQGGSGLWGPGSSECDGGPGDAGPQPLPQEHVEPPGTDGAGAAPAANAREGDETWSPGGGSSDGGKENAGAASDPDSEPRRVPPVRCGAGSFTSFCI